MNIIEPEQHGSQKEHRSDTCGMGKVLFTDILRQNRQAAGITFIDMEKCYDRIAHNIPSLMLQHVRIPEAPVMSMFSTLQNLVHKVLSAYGISEDEYGGI